MAASPEQEDGIGAALTEAEREQAIFIATNTTPMQRLQWLEEMLDLLRDYLPRKDILTDEEKRLWEVGERP